MPTRPAPPYTYLVDDIVVTTPSVEPPPPPIGIVLETDFEDGLDGWMARNAQGNPTVAVTTAEAHGDLQAALVSNRTGQGDGIGHDVTGIVLPGGTYEITAWVKFAAGAGNGDIWLSMQRVNGGSSSFDTVGQFTGVTDGAWREVTANYVMTNADTAFLYFETAYPDGTPASFLVDDIVVESLAPPEIEDITPVKDTVDFNIGVAIDSRETAGSAAALLLRHFDQVTPENHMKPEAWYDAARNFGIHPEATAIMDFADANGLDVYGHTLVWHSQTPAWFFESDAGTPLTASEADRAILRDRMRRHIFSIAGALSAEYGLFGSDTNPLVAWDVVNEVVSDGTTEADGLRRSRWYDVLGEEYIDLAFMYADEAFNEVYAAAGSDRPVVLAINDYNTEQAGKRQRMHDLVERLLGQRGAGRRRRPSVPPQPVDAGRQPRRGVGRVRGPARHAGRQRTRRHDRHAGDGGAADRPGLLLPRRVPHLPCPHRRPVLGDGVGAHRQPQLAGGSRRPAPVRRRVAVQAGVPRRRRRRAAGAPTVGVRVQVRLVAHDRVTRVGVAAVAHDRRRHRVPAAMGHRLRDRVRRGRRRDRRSRGRGHGAPRRSHVRRRSRRQRYPGRGGPARPVGRQWSSCRCRARRSVSSSSSTSKWPTEP